MKTMVYNPKRRILTILDDGYAVISFAGNIAERKFAEALGTGASIGIVDDSCRMKLRPANINEFLCDALEASTHRVIFKRKGAKK